MKSYKGRIKGKFHEMKGKAKKNAGRVVNNPDIESEGRSEDLAGKVQRKSGRLN